MALLGPTRFSGYVLSWLFRSRNSHGQVNSYYMDWYPYGQSTLGCDEEKFQDHANFIIQTLKSDGKSLLGALLASTLVKKSNRVILVSNCSNEESSDGCSIPSLHQISSQKHFFKHF